MWLTLNQNVKHFSSLSSIELKIAFWFPSLGSCNRANCSLIDFSSAFKDLKVKILKMINFVVAIVQYCFCLVIGRFFFLSFNNRFYLSSLVSAFLDISFGHEAEAAGISWGLGHPMPNFLILLKRVAFVWYEFVLSVLIAGLCVSRSLYGRCHRSLQAPRRVFGKRCRFQI